MSPYVNITEANFRAHDNFVAWQRIKGQLKNQSPVVRSLKVPKLYRPFSGVTIPFASQEQRGFKSSNFTVLFVFVALKNMLKDQLSKASGLQFHKWLFRPKKFSGRSRNRALGRTRMHDLPTTSLDSQILPKTDFSH